MALKLFNRIIPQTAFLNAGHPLANDLKIAYLMNDPARRLLDASSNRMDATVTTPATTPKSQWNLGGELLFTGNAQRYTSPSRTNHFSGEFSFAMWFNLTNTSANRVLWRLDDGSGTEASNLYYVAGGDYVFDRITSATNLEVGITSINSATTWYFLGGVYRSLTDFKAYAGTLSRWVGDVTGTVTNGTGTPVTASRLTLGNDTGGTTGWNGSIGVTYFWGRPLIQEEFQELWANPYAMFQPNVKKLWVKPSASGGTVQNGSANVTATATATATGFKKSFSSSAVTATATVTGIATKKLYGSSSITATVTVTVNGFKKSFSSSAVNAVATISAVGSGKFSGSSAINALATVTATASKKLFGSSSTLDGIASATGTANKKLTGSSAVTATGAATGTGFKKLTGNVTLSAVASTTGTALKRLFGQSSVIGTADSQAAGSGKFHGSASVTAVAITTATAFEDGTVYGSASITATATATANGLKRQFGSSVVTATSTATGTSKKVLYGNSSVTSTATSAATGLKKLLANVILNAVASVNAFASAILKGSTSLIATATGMATGTVTGNVTIDTVETEPDIITVQNEFGIVEEITIDASIGITGMDGMD